MKVTVKIVEFYTKYDDIEKELQYLRMEILGHKIV